MAKRRTAEEWLELVRLYRERDCTQKEFINRHGISSASLDHHLRKRPTVERFVPVAVEAKKVVQEIVLEFPSGVCLKIRG